MARRSARVDGNHGVVMLALRGAGVLVWDLSAVGKGICDLLVLTPWSTLVLVEVKDGSKSPSRRKLTPNQVEFFERWRRAPKIVALSGADAIAQLWAMRP